MVHCFSILFPSCIEYRIKWKKKFESQIPEANINQKNMALFTEPICMYVCSYYNFSFEIAAIKKKKKREFY